MTTRTKKTKKKGKMSRSGAQRQSPDKHNFEAVAAATASARIDRLYLAV